MPSQTSTILIQARDQASATIGNIYNVTINNNQKLASSQTTAAAAADKHKFSIVDLAAKLYLVQVGLRNIAQVVEGGFKLAELGAEIQQQSLALKQLVEGAGANYLVFLTDLRKATDGTISDFELQAIASKALIGTSGELRDEMIQALPTILEISKAYSDLHPEVGGTQYAFESLVTGIRRSSIRLIDNAGIVVKLGDLYDQYAKKMGIANRELTAQEQQLAIVNGIQVEGLKIVDQAGNEISVLTDRYEHFRAQAENLKGGLGQLINDGISPLVDSLGLAFAATNNFIVATQALLQLPPEAVSKLEPFEKAVYDLGVTWMQANAQAERGAQVIFGPFAKSMEDYLNRVLDASGAQGDFTEEIETSVEQVNEFADIIADEKFADAWASTVDKLIDKQVELNNTWFDAMQDWEAKSIDIANDLNDKLNDIQQDAIEKRADAWADFSDRIEEMQYDLADRMREIHHDLTISMRNEDDSYDDRKRDLERRKYETTRDFSQKQEDLIRAVNEATTDEERKAASERLAIARREFQDKLDDIEYDLSELKRKHEREKTQIEERYRWEEERFKEHNAHQQQELQEDLNAKLAKITESEASATQAANEAAETRRKKALEELEETKKAIDEKFKLAWLEALQAVAPAGSELHNMLDEAILRTKGASDETINFRGELLKLGSTAAGLQGIFASLGFMPQGGFSQSMAQLQQMIAMMNFVGSLPFGGGRASGGSVSPGNAYMVGESGPEMFVPSSTGTIMPNGGGGTVIVQANGPFMGSQAEAIRWGQMLIPIIAKGLQGYNVNLFAQGSRRTASRA